MYSTLREKVCAALIALVTAALPVYGVFAQSAATSHNLAAAIPDTIVVHSVDELFGAIEQHNPEIAAAMFAAMMLRSDADAVQSLPDPTAGLTVLPLPIHTARGEQVLQLRAEQMIPWPGKTSLDRSMAQLQADAAGAGSAETSLDVRSKALGLVVDLGRIDAVERTIRAYSRRLLDLEEVAAIRYEVGQGPQSAIVKSQVERSDLDLRLAAVRGARMAALAEMRAAVGAPVRLAFDPGETPMFEIESRLAASPDSLLEIAFARRGAFQQLRSLQRHSDVAVERARLNLKPDFGLGVTWFAITDSDMPPSSDGRDALGIGVSMRVPLHFDEKRARVERARLSGRKSDEAMRNLVASTRAGIERQAAEVRSFSEQLDLFRTSLIPRAELSAATSLRAYESGSASYLDLLDAERTLFRLRLERIETEARLQHGLIRLARIVGLGPFSY